MTYSKDRKKPERRSAKDVIEAYTYQLLDRKGDPHLHIKLAVIEAICLKMSWNELYNKLRYRGQGIARNGWSTSD